MEASQLVLGETNPEHRALICSPPLPQEAVLHSGLPQSGYVYFKFEPFVLHVMCATLQDARDMVCTNVLHSGWEGGEVIGWVGM